MKAENALNDLQSRFVLGFAKLKAKIMNTIELISTNDQSPYDELMWFIYLVLLKNGYDPHYHDA